VLALIRAARVSKRFSKGGSLFGAAPFVELALDGILLKLREIMPRIPFGKEMVELSGSSSGSWALRPAS
jgi:hypothetical protein